MSVIEALIVVAVVIAMGFGIIIFIVLNDSEKSNPKFSIMDSDGNVVFCDEVNDDGNIEIHGHELPLGAYTICECGNGIVMEPVGLEDEFENISGPIISSDMAAAMKKISKPCESVEVHTSDTVFVDSKE